MARLPRLSIPGLPHHIIHRGHNRQPVFTDEADRERLLVLLAEQARAHQVAVHAYVLLDSQIELLATPEDAEGVARMMQGVGRAYVRYINARTGRSGTLWEGRYRAGVLQPARYLLACMASMDLQPVRAGLVEAAAAWRWSSHRHYIGQVTDRLVTPHPLYWHLGNTPFAREQAYARRVEEGVPAAEVQALTDAALHGWGLGDAAFLEELHKQTGRRPVRGRPGRPTRASRP